MRVFMIRHKKGDAVQKDSYLALIKVFPLASIRSESHLRAAQVVMDRLLAKGKLTKARRSTWMR